MTALELLAELRRIGVGFRLDGERIRVIAPAGVLTDDLREQLRLQREDVLAALRTPSAADPGPIAARPRNGPAPVSSAQRRLWFLHQLSPLAADYNVPTAIRMSGPLDVEPLRRALTRIAERHEILRTTFPARDGVPVQLVHPAGPVQLPVLQVPAGGGADAMAESVIASTASAPFDLERGPVWRACLLRLGEEEHLLVLVMHHIVCDEWSSHVLREELSALYAAERAGETADVPALPLQYADYAIWQQDRLSGAQPDADLGYWREQLRGLSALALPTDRPRGVPREIAGAVAEFTVPGPVAAGIRALASAHGSTPFIALLAAFSALLSRYCGSTDIAVGTPVAGRDRPELEHLVGFFINSLVLRVDLSGNPSFNEVLRRTRKSALGAYSHQQLPFEVLVEELAPHRDPARNPLFDVMFRLERHRREFELDHVEVCEIPLASHTSKFDLSFAMTEGPNGGLWGGIEYATALFDAATIEQLMHGYLSVLAAVVADPDRRLGELPLPGIPRQARPITGNQEPATAAVPGLLVHELIQAQAIERPDDLAIVAGETRLTYRELCTRAARLAKLLQDRGAAPEETVAVCMGRGTALITALLGVLWSGAAYLPLDPRQPAARIRGLLGEATPVLVLAGAGSAGCVDGMGYPVVILEDFRDPPPQDIDVPPARPRPANLAYEIYTSGSTGQPKAVAITHGGLQNLLADMAARFPMAPGDGLLAITTVSFDIAALELFLPLTRGATVHVADDADAHDPGRLAALLQRPGISLMQATPATWRMLLDSGWPGKPGLRVLCGGEALPAELSHRLAQTGMALTNLYGPTETTIWSCWHQVSPAQGASRVPIGRPIAGTVCHVLDEYGNIAPDGAAGELHIGGSGLARGYARRPDLAAERFVPDPFAADGSRLYRTGDRARRRRDGILEFLGRADDQIKIRGFRIEPAEVEAALTTHPQVSAAAVTVRPGPDGEDHLVGCFVPARARTAPARPAQLSHIAAWQQVWECAVDPDPGDPSFDTTGWVASDTGQPIPAAEMREWVDETVQRIQLLRPRRVAEIGCGTGLLLWRIAPQCETYTATDFAAAPLHALSSRLPGALRERVSLLHRDAADVTGLEHQAYDLVVMNSVAQYFPGAGYLQEVLTGALKLLRPGGQLFLGDLRSLPLLSLHHANVTLARTGSSGAEELREHARAAERDEAELALDPRWFRAVGLPGVTHVQVLPKLGTYHNELTRFRYDVILHTADPGLAEPHCWLDWCTQQLDLAGLRQYLASHTGDTVGINRIPNARIHSLLPALAWADTEWPQGQTAEPSSLTSLGHQLGFGVELSWAAAHPAGAADAVFIPHSVGAAAARFPLPEIDQPATHYANDPVAAATAEEQRRSLEAEVRDHLTKLLPEYLVPSALDAIDRLPLTPAGKLDRRALPGLTSRTARRTPRPAETDTQRALAAIWCEILGAVQPGRDDSFFELGGHSLLATRVVSRISARLGVELPLRALFENPTIGALATAVDATRQQTAAPAIVPVPRSGPLPVSFAQQRLWFLSQLRPNSAEHNLTVALRLAGALDAAALRAALDALVSRHEPLRTTFPATDGIPQQVIGPPQTVGLPISEASEQEAANLVAEEGRVPVDLENGPLLRARLLHLAESGDHVLILATHHIVCDDRSVEIITEELGVLYHAFSHGGPGPLPPLRVQYADYAVWQRTERTEARLQTQLTYWESQLGGIQTLRLPTDRRLPAVRDPAAGWVEDMVPAATRERLHQLGRAHHATPFMVLIAAFQLLLSRYAGQEDICVGTPADGRAGPDTESLVGLFLNTLVLRANLAGDPPFTELLDRVRDVALDAYHHQDLPFEQLVEHLTPERDRSRHPLFQVIVNYAIEPETSPGRPDDLRADGFGGPSDAAKFDLRLVLLDAGSGITIRLQYRRDIFDHGTAERMAARLRLLLTAISQQPDERISLLPIMDQAERDQLMSWSARPGELPGPELPELLAARTSSGPAVSDQTGTLSYTALNNHVNQMAHHLAALGAAAETVVAIFLRPGVDMIIAMFGAWRAGAAITVLDPAEPLTRVTDMLAAAGASLVVTDDDLADTLPASSPPVTTGAAARGEAEWPPGLAHRPDRLAYLVFTSGTTGSPKPVGVTHANLAFYCHSILQELHPPAGTWALVQPLTADLGYTNVICALGSGGHLKILTPDSMIPALIADPPDHLKFTPTHLGLLLSHPRGREGLPRQTLITGGEAPPSQLLDTLASSGWAGRLYNHYGPAETTVGATTDRLRQGHLTLGRPLPGVSCLLLDQRGHLVPVGVPGEIHVGGPGVTRGYRGRPDLTAERFVANPYGPPGSRLYRTGDLGRWTAAGTIEFLGRSDTELSLAARRIDPAEVENTLLSHPEISAAAVDVRPGPDGTPRLCAWVAPAVPAGMRAWLGTQLPAYLIPASWTAIAALPRTSAGKLDRRLLPEPASAAAVPQDPPRTPTECTLAELWGSMLGLPQISRGDDFFDVGGHSLLAAQLITRIPRLFEVDVPLGALFDHPRLDDLAAHIDQLAAGEPSRRGPGSPLLVMNRAAARKRLFCVHPLSGSTFCFRPIAAGMGSVAEFVAIEAQGLQAGLAPHRRIEDMAACYVSAIRDLQPAGPYLIAGWSFGSMVALEVAQQLRRGGEEVEFLCLIGPTNIERRHGTPEVSPSDMRRLRRIVRQLVAGEAAERDELARAVFPLACEPAFAGDPSSYDPELLLRRLQVLAAHRRAAARYRPRPYPGRSILVMPETAHSDDPLIVSQWNEVSRGGVELASAPGDHLSMVMDPRNARAVARVLRERLGEDTPGQASAVSPAVPG